MRKGCGQVRGKYGKAMGQKPTKKQKKMAESIENTGVLTGLINQAKNKTV
jgi:hypothetical protein